MENKKLSLSELKVQSFVTSLGKDTEETLQLKGGNASLDTYCGCSEKCIDVPILGTEGWGCTDYNNCEGN